VAYTTSRPGLDVHKIRHVRLELCFVEFIAGHGRLTCCVVVDLLARFNLLIKNHNIRTGETLLLYTIQYIQIRKRYKVKYCSSNSNLPYMCCTHAFTLVPKFARICIAKSHNIVNIIYSSTVM